MVVVSPVRNSFIFKKMKCIHFHAQRSIYCMLVLIRNSVLHIVQSSLHAFLI